MKAAIFQGVNRLLSVEDIPIPTIASDELLIEVSYCGICGTDLHCTQKGLMTMSSGTILGHEFSGKVVDIGSEVKSLWQVGNSVTAFPANSCGQCHVCRKGNNFLCKNLKIIGLSNIPGGYASYVKIKSAAAIKLPEAFDLRESALVEPLAIALHAVDIANIRPFDQVLVLGAGPIGLAVAQFARLLGSRNIVVSEKLEYRRNLAAKFGATALIDPLIGSVEEQFKCIVGELPTLIFECIGNPGSIQECISLASAGSKIIVVGVCMDQDTILPLSAMMKELTIKFSLGCRKEDFEIVIDLLKNQRIRALDMISDIVGFHEFPIAFESLRVPKEQCKVLLNPQIEKI